MLDCSGLQHVIYFLLITNTILPHKSESEKKWLKNRRENESESLDLIQPRSKEHNLGKGKSEHAKRNKTMLKMYRLHESGDLKGAYEKQGEQLFKEAERDRTRGNGFKLKEERVRLEIRKNSWL